MVKKVLGKIFGTILYFACIILAAWLIIHFVAQRTTVDGSSMEPTLSDCDNLIMDKISYRFVEPERFDIIVFPFKEEKDTYYIKRIIGMPGETVFIDSNGLIYIDGEILSESYGKEVIKNAGMASQEITLLDDEYFVLGDNRNHSSDSREERVGLIKRKDIIGKAVVRIYPLDEIELLD